MQPAFEVARLETLRQYNVLDTPAEQVFDDIRLLAAQICGTPMAMIGFVDADRVWFKSGAGEFGAEIARRRAFCAQTILQTEPLIITDTLADKRFATNPLVTAETGIRFYAGVSLRTPDGHAVGTLCVLDRLPRTLEPEQIEALGRLGRQVVALLEARRQITSLPRAISLPTEYQYSRVSKGTHEQRQSEFALRTSEVSYLKAFNVCPDPIIISDLAGGRLIFVSDGFLRLTGYTRAEVLGRTALEINLWSDSQNALYQSLLEKEGRIYKREDSFRLRSGELCVGLFSAEIIEVFGERSVISFITDITARKLTEQQLAAHYDVVRVLAEASTLAEATLQLLQTICESFNWSLGALWFVNYASGELRCVESWHQPVLTANEFLTVSQQARFRPNAGFPGYVWAAKSAIWIADIAKETRFPRAPIAARAGLHTAIGFPIRLGDEILGVMEFYSVDIRQADDNLLNMMTTIGIQIGQFAVRKRAEEGLQKAHLELEERVLRRTEELASANLQLQTEIAERQSLETARIHLLHRLVDAHEEERARIARELHDKMGQYLTALILGLEGLKSLAQGQPALSTHLTRIMGISDELAREVHHLAWELRPVVLDGADLHTVLSNYLSQWSTRFDVEVDFHCSGLSEQQLPSEIEVAIYRIIQETLTNVLKHAKAHRVSVIIECRQNFVKVIMEDDGRGFDTEQVMRGPNSRGGLGLVGMRERAALVAGTFEIESTPGVGTTMFLRIPIPSAM